MSTNITAALTVTALGAATIGTCFAASAAATIAATVAWVALAILGSAASLAAITAYFKVKTEPEDDTPTRYFELIKDHLLFTLPGTMEVVAKRIFSSLIDSLGRIVGDTLYRRATGYSSRA